MSLRKARLGHERRWKLRLALASAADFQPGEFQPLLGFLGEGMFYAPLKIRKDVVHI